MSSNEDEASEISREDEELIKLLDGNYAKHLDIDFFLGDLDTNPSYATVEITLRDTNSSNNSVMWLNSRTLLEILPNGNDWALLSDAAAQFAM